MTNTNYEEKPVAGKSLSYGWSIMKLYFLPLLLIVIVELFVQIPVGLFRGDKHQPDMNALKVLLEFLSLAYWLLVLPVILYGCDMLFVRAIRHEKIDFKELISGFSNYLNIILTHLFVTALIGIAFVALIIPGIIVACRLAFVSYLVMDKGLDPIAAVETSWKMTRGYAWRVFWLGFTCIFIFIAGFICLFVGVFPALMWCKASFASLYQAILNERGDLFPADQPAE